MLYYKPLGRKSVANSVFVALLLLSIAALSVFYLSTRNRVFDNLHLIILLGAIAANLKAMPFTSSDTKYLSHTNVLEGFSEAVIIHDRKGRIAHIHDGLKTVKLSARLTDIQAKLMEAGALNDTQTLPEGRITIEDESPVHLQYKVSTLQIGGRYLAGSSLCGMYLKWLIFNWNYPGRTDNWSWPSKGGSRLQRP